MQIYQLFMEQESFMLAKLQGHVYWLAIITVFYGFYLLKINAKAFTPWVAFIINMILIRDLQMKPFCAILFN